MKRHYRIQIHKASASNIRIFRSSIYAMKRNERMKKRKSPSLVTFLLIAFLCFCCCCCVPSSFVLFDFNSTFSWPPNNVNCKQYAIHPYVDQSWFLVPFFAALLRFIFLSKFYFCIAFHSISLHRLTPCIWSFRLSQLVCDSSGFVSKCFLS